jgi:hypothetical protein
MSRTHLRYAAVFLTVLIVIVIFAGLDRLPSGLRAQIDSERATLAAAQSQLQTAKDAVSKQVASDAAYFHAIPAAQQWPDRFARDATVLQYASRDLAELTRMEKEAHYRDRQRAQSLLSDEQQLRTTALSDASAIQKEAAHWTDVKQHLPQEVQQMEKDYQAIRAVDLAPLTAAVQKAETDFPDKKPDLEARLGALRGPVTQADSVWQSSAAVRRQAASGDTDAIDYAALLGTADTLNTEAAALPQQTAVLAALVPQLYTSWDKVLVDMEVRGTGTARAWDQQIRTVRTQTQTGAVTSDEKWVDVSQGRYEADRNHLGMAIEHKPAGKYDSEAESVAQPAGFAYVAPPTQASNQYGYWDHRDGQSFWVFYGQYALLRDLLFNHSYRPVERGDWEGYHTSQRSGQTYYGRGEGSSEAPKYGTQGTETQKRYSGSTYAKSGGFRDSDYASHGGSYRSSPYASPSARDPQGDHSARRFGRSAPEEPHAAPHTYRPAPRPAPRPPMRSPGRVFGGRRR